MTSNSSPPGYTEEHWCIFDAATGEILATETIWTEDGADDYDRGPSAAVLREVADGRRGRPVEVDTIQVDNPPGADERVDVSSGELVKKSPPTGEDVLGPQVLSGP